LAEVEINFASIRIGKISLQL